MNFDSMPPFLITKDWHPSYCSIFQGPVSLGFMNKYQRTGTMCLTLSASPDISGTTINTVNSCWVSLAAILFDLRREKITLISFSFPLPLPLDTSYHRKAKLNLAPYVYIYMWVCVDMYIFTFQIFAKIF